MFLSMHTQSFTSNSDVILPAGYIENRIYMIRGEKVMLDSDLARLYQVPVKRLNEQVTRNIERFPPDFMFRLHEQEYMILKSQFATLGKELEHRPRARPRVFTEHGIAMLSSVLKSKQAVLVNVAIIRAFIKIRRLLASNAHLAKRLDALEKEYDSHFRRVFKAIRKLMKEDALNAHKRIGFKTE